MNNTIPSIFRCGTGVIVAVFALMSVMVVAQPRVPQSRMSYGDLVSAEAVQLPGKPGSCRIDAFIRITHDFIVFQRVAEQTKDSVFHGRIEVSYDLIDEKGQTVSTAHDRTSLQVRGYLATDSRDDFLLLHRSFECTPGQHTLVLSINDGSSTREREIRLPFTAKSFSSKPVAASIIPLDDTGRSRTSEYLVAAYGGSIPFARSSRVVVSGSAPASSVWTFSVRRPGIDGQGGIDVSKLVLTPTEILPSTTGPDSTGVLTSFPLRRVEGTEGSLYVFVVPYDTLDPGTYALEVAVHHEGSTDTLRQHLRVYWKDMPRSLQDPVFALSVMRHILTDEETDELERGPDDRLGERIFAWWKKKDPSRGTARNEMLEEYFRRADEAYYAYQTLSQPNGALSDRGKVHILYGVPVSTERVLDPGEPAKEVWLYPALKKTFLFVDRERNGNYRLARP